MKIASSISLLVGVVWGMSHAVAAPASYTLAYSDNPPFSMTYAGKPQGTVVNLVSQLFNKAGLSYQLVDVPLARAMMNAQRSERYCVFPVQRSQAIEAEYQWISPILATSSGLFIRPDSPLQFTTLSDAKRLTIGVLRGSGNVEYLRNLGLNVEEANTQEQNLDKLFAKRFDVWATDVSSANFFIRKASNQGKVPKQALIFRATLGSLACNIKMPAQDFDKLQSTLDSMIKDGSMQKITH